MPTVDEVVSKYVEIRDRKAELAKRHAEELSPYNEAQENIEKWLLNKMNEDGVNSYKTDSGTPYKNVATSVKLVDPDAFKDAIFAPVVEKIEEYILDGELQRSVDILPIVKNIIRDSALWDMVDFRAGKKGIQARLEETNTLPPGITMDSFTTVNIRRG